MLHLTTGDMFATEADVRVNTVNCVGVMGAGVALAFKTRFPAMFRDYQKACKAEELRPGLLHVWTEAQGVVIVNFPTKRHWRHPSRYEDIDAGLVALHQYLAERGRVRVTLPALGCGHGGLDWDRVSPMIHDRLGDLQADIFVFEPSASREVGEQAGASNRPTLQELETAGVAVAHPGESNYPEALRGTSAAVVYSRGSMVLLRRPCLTVLPSLKPSEREQKAALSCVEAVARPGLAFLVGYGPDIERPLIRAGLERGADIIVSLAEGILPFRVRRDLQDVWDDDRVLVVSTARPDERWSTTAATRARALQLRLARAALITDPRPSWLGKVARGNGDGPKWFYVDYGPEEAASRKPLQDLHAQPVTRDARSGSPNVAGLLASLQLGGPTPGSETVTNAVAVLNGTATVLDAGMPDHQRTDLEQTVGAVQPVIAEAPQSESLVPTVAPTQEPIQQGGSQHYVRRLIEVDLPIKRISAHARREKSIRHGHISTLHIWWARRPLAACRAVICAALWPDPADPLCPQAFRDVAGRTLVEFAERITRTLDKLATCGEETRGRWEALAKGGDALNPTDKDHLNLLRHSLLDFIADFADWDNSTVPEYLEAARALTQAAHEALGGEPGTRPLVVDPFAGGGSIPLEALRVGADAFASDLNPVAVLLNKVVLEYIPKYGQRLADEVRKWGQWIKGQAEKELAAFYPRDPDGATPIAYLWARTITCEGPGCGTEVPLMRSLWLAKKGNRSVALRLVPKPRAKRVDFEIVENAKAKDVGEGSVRRGSATCPCCGFTTPVASVRRQLKERHGGAADARLYCVVTTRLDEQGRFYRLPNERDLEAVRNAAIELQRRNNAQVDKIGLVPEEPTPQGGGGGAGRAFSQRHYGMDTFRDLFTPRQMVALTTLTKLVRRAGDRTGHSDELPEAVQTCLALCFNRVADLSNSLCGWKLDVQCPTHLFARQAIPIVWDFSESVCTTESSGAIVVMTERLANVLKEIGSDWTVGTSEQCSATAHPLPDNSAHAMITDPPYYDAVPYADLSDFFYVWFKRTLPDSLRRSFSEPLTPKSDECIVDEVKGKDRAFFEGAMRQAMAEGRRILSPYGIAVVVFAHKTTSGWEALLQAMVDAGWTITGSWPIDTEMGTRLRARDSAALASSVHLVCRPRVESHIGDWRDVLTELPNRIHDWMPRLASEGVVGADAIFACLGPALEIFSRYGRVEKASGEQVTLKEYLEHVWAAVAKEALSMIFAGADATGFDPDARLTAMWFWTVSAGAAGNGNTDDGGDEEVADAEDSARAAARVGGFVLEYDAARKIAQGLGAHLEQLTGIVEVKGDKARLLPVGERATHVFGKEEGRAPARRKKTAKQRGLFDETGEEGGDAETWTDLTMSRAGATVLDRLHQSMILFGAGRGEALKRFLVEEGVGQDQRFWRLAQALSALYPVGTEEKRWVDGVLGRKKGLGL